MLISRAQDRAALVVLVMLAACAKIEAPPGAPPDLTPPRLVAMHPDSLAVIPGFSGDVVFQFDEVIAEGSIGQTGGNGDLDRLVLLSPTSRPAVVRWHRDHITVRPREGWVANRVYRVQLFPGATDLRNNRSNDAAAVITFTTGAPLPTDTVSGLAWDWVGGRPGAGALIQARLLPDSLVYRAIADSSGRFRLGPIPAGAYLVSAIVDQNRDLQQDGREAFDSVRLEAGRKDAGTLWMYPHDTAGPRIQTIMVLDSMSATLTLSQALDPAQRLTAAAATVRRLPDSTAVEVRSVLPAPVDDSIQRRADTTAARRPAPADTGRRSADSTRRAPPGRAAALPSAPSRAAQPDSVPGRPPLTDRVVLRVGVPWKAGARYTVEIRGIRNVSGIAADSRGGLAVPDAPKPPPAAPVTAPTDSVRPAPTSRPDSSVRSDSAARRVKPR